MYIYVYLSIYPSLYIYSANSIYIYVACMCAYFFTTPANANMFFALIVINDLTICQSCALNALVVVVELDVLCHNVVRKGHWIDL